MVVVGGHSYRSTMRRVSKSTGTQKCMAAVIEVEPVDLGAETPSVRGGMWRALHPQTIECRSHGCPMALGFCGGRKDGDD